MKRKQFIITLIMAIVMMAMCPANIWAEITKPASGDGTAANPYQIGTADELMWFMTEASKATWSNQAAYNAELTKDIVINENLLKTDGTLNSIPFVEWVEWVMPYYYFGTFDGKGHTISGIYNTTYNYGTAMFVCNNGTIRNLGVRDSYFGSHTYNNATFAAHNYGTITDCYSFATIDGTDYNGGIAGDCDDDEISNCFFAGKMTSASPYNAPICSDYSGSEKLYKSVHNNYFLESCLKPSMKNLRSTAVTLEEMKSGKVAFYLQAGRANTVWGQTLTGEDKQDYPVLGGTAVYVSQITCDGKPAEGATISNTEVSVVKAEHEYVNFKCTKCNEYPCPEEGLGTQNKPYKIGTAGELLWFMTEATKMNEYTNLSLFAELTADIVINKGVLKADGTLNGTPAVEWIMPKLFYGALDGTGHTISGIYNPASKDSTAMFVINHGDIYNLGVLDSYFGAGRSHTATFAASNEGIISECYSFATIDGTTYNGGIAGTSYISYYSDCGISNCFFAGKMTSTAETSAPICSDYDDEYDEDQTSTIVHNNYFLANCLNSGMKNLRSTSVTLDEMKSGKVAHMLQNARTDNVWGQTLAGENKQDYPVLGGAPVYSNKLECDGKTAADGAVFANNEPDNVNRAAHKDSDNDHFCNACGYLMITEAPVLVTADNYAALGLTADYVGYKAISNLGQLAGYAEELGAPLTKAKEIEDSQSGTRHAKAKKAGDARNESAKTAAKGKANAKAKVARRVNTPALPTSKYVLAADIVVNSNLINADGTVNEYDDNNNFRNLIAWSSPDVGSQDDEEVSAVIFDGNNHTISGIYQNIGAHPRLETEGWAGYFGFADDVTESSAVKNLGITNSYFTDKAGEAYIGSIANYCKGTVEKCWSDATIDASNRSEIAGIVADFCDGKITGCSYTGTIRLNDNNRAAGIAYYVYANNELEISDCQFSGKVIVNGDYCDFSGIANDVYSYEPVNISKCYVDGKIENYSKNLGVTGLVEESYLKESINISNCYNAMTISNDEKYDMVGLVYEAWNNSSSGNGKMNITNCFSYGDYSDADNFYPLVYSSYYTNISNCYYLQDKYLDLTGAGKTTEEFASGELAYTFNGSKSTGTAQEPLVWYQEIGVDKYPVLKGDEYTVVYIDQEKENYYNTECLLDNYALVDGKDYDLKHDFKVGSLTYQRSFTNTAYDALYVPFAMSYSDYSDKADIYRLLNIFEYDNDDNGSIDEWVLKVVKLKAGEKTKANTPYIIKPKKTGEMKVALSDVTLARAQQKNIWCASLDNKFVFTGTYAKKTIDADSYFLVSANGDMKYSNSAKTVAPQRWYMGIYDKETNEGIAPSAFTSSASSAKAIRIVCDDDNIATGISQMENGEWRMENGKYLENGRIVIIKNGVKCNINGQSIK